MRRLVLAFMACASVAHADGVTVKVHFAAAAAHALNKAGELVVLSGYFYGEPAKTATLKPDEMNQLYLGGEEFKIRPFDQTITFGQTLASAPVDQMVEPYLNVNIYSARLSNGDNLLDCDFLDDSVRALSAGEHVLVCKLIGG